LAVQSVESLADMMEDLRAALKESKLAVLSEIQWAGSMAVHLVVKTVARLDTLWDYSMAALSAELKADQLVHSKVVLTGAKWDEL